MMYSIIYSRFWNIFNDIFHVTWVVRLKPSHELRIFMGVKSSKRVLAMVRDNLSKYFPIVMNFSGYLPLYEDTSAIDFEPDRSIRLAGHAPKVGHNELDLLWCV